MAAYADIDFATSLYGEDYVKVSFDRDGDGEIDTVATEMVFEVVSSEIDSYLVGRVPLPLTDVPLDLKMRCVDLCIYRMCPDAARLTEEKKARFEAAISYLKMVARNEVKLTFDSAPAAGTHLTQRARIVTQEEACSDQDGSRMFSRRKLRGLL